MALFVFSTILKDDPSMTLILQKYQRFIKLYGTHDRILIFVFYIESFQSSKANDFGGKN